MEDREQFTSGAVRDSQLGKSRPDLISPFFLKRLGDVLAKGAVHYSARNWEKGIESSRCYASLSRHLNQWAMGENDGDDDHLGQAAFNLMAIIHNEEVLPDIHDMPPYDENRKAIHINKDENNAG